MSDFHNTKRIAIINKAGSGKSTLARFMIESEIVGEDGYWITDIYTNAEIYSGDMFKGEVDLDKNGNKIWNPLRYKSQDRPEGVRRHYIKTMRELETPKRGLLYLDELIKCMPARRSGSDFNLVYGTLMSNIRHVESHFLYTDQYRKGGDILLRTNVDDLLIPIPPEKSGKDPLEYWVYDNVEDANFDFLANPPNSINNALLDTKVSARNIWNLFKTTDIPTLMYNEAFGVQTYAEELLNWKLPVSNSTMGNILKDFNMRDSRLKDYIMLYEELQKKHLIDKQRRALIAYLDSVGLLAKYEPKERKK